MKVKYGPYSPSRIDVATCPYRFKEEYILKNVQDEGSLASRRGNVVHETFELITRGWLVDQPLTWEKASEELVSRLASYQITDHEDRKTIIEATKCYMGNPPRGIEDILGTEEHLALKYDGNSLVECDWDDPECFARGKIDILQIKDKVATIIDHKTQMYVPPNKGTFQMGVYAWMVKQFYPYVEEVRTVLHFCHPNLNFYSQPHVWSLDDLSSVEEELKIAIRTIESYVDFPAVPNHYCVYCPLKQACPKLEDLSKKRMSLKKAKNGPLISAKEAKEHAEAFTVLEENREIMQKQLKNFTKEIGSVIIPGIEYGYKVSEGWEVPIENKKALYELLNKLGIDTWQYIDFNINKLGKSVWKVLPKEQLEEVKTYLLPTKATRFGKRKV
jgi:CRISPR/Cas system-associated exonuclease Cas4 (RecB family)